MAWLILFLAGVLEVGWAVALKSGGRSPWANGLMVAAMIGSFVLLSRAMREIPVGTAYAVWTGIGAVGVATIGILWLGESASPKRVASLALVVAGIVGLKLSSR